MPGYSLSRTVRQLHQLKRIKPWVGEATSLYPTQCDMVRISEMTSIKLGTRFDNLHVKERPAMLPVLGIGHANGFCPIVFGLRREGFDTAATFPHDVFGAVTCYRWSTLS